MKRSILIAISLLPWLGTTAYATDWILNSAHNFSSYAWSGSEICKPCHTPHNAPNPASVSKAMWNHTLTNASYIMSGGVPGTAANDLDKVSRLCLSCHDGTIAIDSFGGGTSTNNWVPNWAKLGTDLSIDHPVGNAAVVKDETGHFTPVNYSTGTIGTGTSTLQLYDNGKAARVIGTNADGSSITRTNYVVSCYSCHSAHGEGIGGFRSPNLLRVDNRTSGLCLTCHIK
jgi:hypothetical protein